MTPEALRIAILGAGPIGLDAALAAREAGLPFTVYEAGEDVGSSLRSWGHVRLFTPWSMNVSGRMRRALAEEGRGPRSWDAWPTGQEVVREVLEPVAHQAAVSGRIRFSTTVVAVSRDGMLKQDGIGDPVRARQAFRILTEGPDGESVESAEVVLDCTGTWGHPNALGIGGIPAPGERQLSDRVVRQIPDPMGEPGRWSGRRVLLVGGGHSAQTAARDFARLAKSAGGTSEGDIAPPSVVWAVRATNPTWGAVEDDPLEARAKLTTQSRGLASGASPAIEVRTGVSVEAVGGVGEGVEVVLRDQEGSNEGEIFDDVVALTGTVGDARLYRQLQIHECYATEGPMKLAAVLLGSSSGDCLAETGHGPEVLRNPEPNFYILGSKSYGRTSTFLLRVGWEQVDDIFSLLRAERSA